MKFYLFCVALCFLGTESSILPERLLKNVCKESDPNYETCFRKSMEIVRSDFMKGIPEIGFKGIEPLATNFTKLVRTMGVGTEVQMIMTNSTVSGFSNAIIQGLRADPKTLFGQIRFVLPSTQFKTEMDIVGRILGVPIDVRGSYEGNFNQVWIQMNVPFYKYQKNGEWYLGLDSDNLQTWIDIGSGTIYIKSADEFQQIAADVFCNWYNDNQVMINKAINPILGDLVNDFIGKQIAEYISKVPASELLPK